MEVKEAIEFIEETTSLLNGFRLSAEGIRQTKEKNKEVISILQQGEKYKAIVEDIDNLIAMDTNDFYREQVKFIKQKYFPQPVKKVITIEVGGEDPDWIIEWFKDKVENLNKTYYKDKIRVNFKEVK